MPEQKTTEQSVSITPNAEKVLKERYLKKDKNGKPIETPKDLFVRVAKSIAENEKSFSQSTESITELEKNFYTLMAEGWFMPNSPTLMNAGREMGMLSACFVLPVGDSIDEIFTSVRNTALIQKAGGGTGFSFSRLRPMGDFVNSSGTTTSGPLPFIKVFSEATNAIQQGAFRRGANMGMMRVDHPDIISFIKIKENLKELTNFNLSVSVTDKFMNDLQEDPERQHTFLNPRTGQEMAVLNEDQKPWKVKELFDLITNHAWKTGEPGLIFIDQINANNPVKHIGEIEATNPCGEQPLLPYESCNLGSINLFKFIKKTKDGNYFDFEKFREVIILSTRFLDNVIDVNQYPIHEIAEMSRGNRKIGLGVMGFADALFSLGVPYNSEEGLAFGKKIMKFLTDESHSASIQLAAERGVFPNWEGSTWQKKGIKIRNACTTTVAPTGTISIIANCSGGIEPVFNLAYQRTILNNQKMIEINDVFKAELESIGLYCQELMEEIFEKGSLQDIKGISPELKRIFVTARDIAPVDHIRMQAAFQEFCDSSISKTINLPSEANIEQVKESFLLAYQLKCKGITVYRDGCRNNQPMSLKAKTVETKETPKKIAADNDYVVPVALPDIMTAIRIRQITPFGNMHIKIVYDFKTEREREVFAQLGKGGELASSDLEAICRMISMYLRVNGRLIDAIKQLDGIGTSLTIPTKDGRIMSLADGLAKGLKKYLAAKKELGINNLILGMPTGETNENYSQQERIKNVKNLFGIKCPECAQDLSFEEGCSKCHSCGYSQC
jgi:ribonucleoside-diphosphate reductase alpha chain